MGGKDALTLSARTREKQKENTKRIIVLPRLLCKNFGSLPLCFQPHHGGFQVKVVSYMRSLSVTSFKLTRHMGHEYDEFNHIEPMSLVTLKPKENNIII